MTEETLETIILGHIAKELKDEIEIARQVNLAKTIIQALRIHDVVGRFNSIKMRTVEVTVTYKYELEIDDNNEIVKEYESENELLVDCATYRFGTGLPVIGDGGVKVKDVELVEVS